MATRLSNLQAAEVSLVPRGANRQNFLIFKDNEGGGFENMGEDMKKIFKNILGEKFEENENIEEILKGIQVSEETGILLKGLIEKIEKEEKEEKEKEKEKVKKEEEEKAKKEKGEKGEKGGADPVKKEDIEKLKVTEEVKKMLSELWKENENMVKKTEDLEKVIKTQIDEKLTSKYISVAKSLSNMSVDADKFGKILKEVATNNSEETMSQIMEVLNGANEVIKKSELFGELGSSAGGNTGAWNKIEKAADKIVEKGEMTKEQAITKAIEQNPELYTEYLREGGEM